MRLCCYKFLVFLVFGIVYVYLSQNSFSYEHQISKEEFLSLFQKVIDNREKIHSGQLEIIHSYTHFSSGLMTDHAKHEIKFAFDTNRRRVERHNTLSTGQSFDDVGCIGCYMPDVVLGYSNQMVIDVDKNELTNQRFITFYDLQQMEEDKYTRLWNAKYGCSPQYLACLATHTFPSTKEFESHKEMFFRNTVERMYLSDVLVEQEDYKGTMCKKISFLAHFRDEIHSYIIWIAEEQGPTIRKMFHNSPQVVIYDETLEVDVVRDAQSGVWYPSHWRYERNDDNQPRMKEEGIVKNAVFNQPLPDHLFEIKNISCIPPGTKILWTAKLIPPPYEGPLVWDGKKVVGLSEYNFGVARAGSWSSRRLFMICVNTAGISAIIAIICFRAWRRQQRMC